MSVLDPEAVVGFLIHDVSRMMRNWFDTRAQHLGLTRAQWRVLIQLSAREGASQRELAEILEIDTVTLSRHIDRLERDDWLERRPDPNDRRVWRLHLTPAARPTLDEMEGLAVELQEAALQGLDAKERAVLVEALHRIKANVVAASAEDDGAELKVG
jgi:DNA-binding MarR family transcriptional regulator